MVVAMLSGIEMQVNAQDVPNPSSYMGSSMAKPTCHLSLWRTVAVSPVTSKHPRAALGHGDLTEDEAVLIRGSVLQCSNTLELSSGQKTLESVGGSATSNNHRNQQRAWPGLAKTTPAFFCQRCSQNGL